MPRTATMLKADNDEPDLHGSAPAPAGSRSKDTPKSHRTRRRILDASLKLFAEIGYHAAHNQIIADEARLTRGAMLYHFPGREDLVEAAANHIQAERLRLLSEAAKRQPAGADASDHAIDSYWRLLREPAFRAFAELEQAARTDPMVAERIRPAQASFDRAQGGGVGGAVTALVQAGAGPRFQASRDLARFLLEGLSRATLTFDDEARAERLLAVIKRATHVLNRKGQVQDLWAE